MKKLRWVLTSLFIVSVAVWGAFALSVNFVTPVHAEVLPEGTPEAAPNVPPVMQGEGGSVGSELPPPPESAMNAQPDGATSGGGQPNIGDQGLNVAPPSVIQNDDGFVYDPSGKRDPFKPYRNIRASLDLGKDKRVQEKDLEPLERYDIEKIQVVAILWEVQNPRAILRTPEGSTHSVVKNSKVGRNFGRVVAIREGELVVQEKIFVDGTPTYEIKTIGLK